MGTDLCSWKLFEPIVSIVTNKKLFIFKLSDIPSNPEIVDYFFLNNIHEKLKSESSKNSRKPGLLAKNRQSSRLNSCFIKYCFFSCFVPTEMTSHL